MENISQVMKFRSIWNLKTSSNIENSQYKKTKTHTKSTHTVPDQLVITSFEIIAANPAKLFTTNIKMSMKL